MCEVIRFPVEQSDNRRDSWVKGLERRIDTALDNLIRYGDPYLHYVMSSEGVDIVDRYNIMDTTTWLYLDPGPYSGYRRGGGSGGSTPPSPLPG